MRVRHLTESADGHLGDDANGFPSGVRGNGDKPGRDRHSVTQRHAHSLRIVHLRDYRSKRTLAYLPVLSALADAGPKEGLPVITIQAN
jgi:hypothetical protein